MSSRGCRRRLTTVATALAFGWAVSLVQAQSAPAVNIGPSSQVIGKLYRIAGTLTDSVTGKAIAHAAVGLAGIAPRTDLQSVVSDDDGQFAFEPVPAGKYSLSARRRGYIRANFDEHERYSSAIVTGEGQDTEHIPFHLDPGGEIRGRVTDDAEEPVANAQVIVKRRSIWGGLGEHLAPVINVTTDEKGVYETWNLYSGKYLLGVKASPWYALHPPMSELESAGNQEQRAALEALDVAYPLTYYDGTTEEGSAAPIEVGIGETVEADFAMHAVPAVHLTVRMPSGTGQSPQWPVVKQTMFGGELDGESVVRRTGSSETSVFEYAVAPGLYHVQGGDPPRIVEMNATGNKDVELAAGIEAAVVTMKVQMADGSPVPKPLTILVASPGSTERSLTAEVGDKGVVGFPAIPPGNWMLGAVNSDSDFAVVAVQIGSRIIEGDCRIALPADPGEITLTIVQGKTRIEGFAFKDGKGLAGVMIVLVPRNPVGNLAEFRRDQSDSDGSFALYDVIPGDYTLVAIEDGWDLDWAKPDVIGRYLPSGAAVTVRAGAPQQIQLSAPVVVQPR